MMKKIVLLYALILSSFAYSQKYEVGAFLGNANYIGDIGSRTYIAPRGLVGGLVAKYNLNPRQAIRLNLNYGFISANDANAKEDYRRARNYNFKRNVGEISAFYEFSFFNFSDQRKGKGSPYIFAGAGLALFSTPKYNIKHRFNKDTNGNVVAPTNSEDFVTEVNIKRELAPTLSIPFGIGYKYRIRRNWVLAAEVGVRYLDSDNFDASNIPDSDIFIETESGLNTGNQSAVINTRNQNVLNTTKFDDSTNNDWLVFTGLTLTYTFGREPCYCK